MSRCVALLPLLLIAATAAFSQSKPVGAQCVDCHSQTTPSVVAEWKNSKHGKLSCDTCHGTDHKTAEDVKLAKTSSTACLQCHA